jgi:hypothetical protein
MMKLHGCKKCQGTLILEKDEFGWYEECMQCGYSRDLPLDMSFNEPLDEKPITVTVVDQSREAANLWKQNKMPTYRPLKSVGRPEDTY